MPLGLAEIMAGAERREDGFALTIPESWKQGRTCYGGLSAALAHEAARQVGGADMAPLRSALTSFVGPVSGEVVVSAKVLRQGRNATWIDARIDGEAGTVLTVSFVFMRAMESKLDLHDAPPPNHVRAAEDAKPFVNPAAPQFLQDNFELRFAQGRPDSPVADFCWWVRLTERDGIDPMSEIMLVGDALPPTVLALLGFRVPVSSMTWQSNLLTAAPATRDGWWLLHGHSDHAESGCSSQRMMSWNADLEPVTQGLQAMAIFG